MNKARKEMANDLKSKGMSPKEAYKTVHKLNLVGYRKPKKGKRNERKKG